MKRILFAIVVLLAITGCVSNSKYRAQEERLANLETQVVQSRESRQGATLAASSDIQQIDLQLRQNEEEMKTLITEQGKLAQTVSDLSNSVVTADQLIVDMISDLEARLDALAAEGLSPEEAARYSVDSNRQVQQNIDDIKAIRADLQELISKVDKIPAETQSSLSAARDEYFEYEAARNEYYKGNYDRAIARLDSFLEKHPDSDYAGNAVYWQGESYYAQRQFKNAMREFQNVLSRYPKSWKNADSQFKIGLTYKQMGDHKSARTELNKVKTDYPNFHAMDILNRELADLK